LTAEKTEVGLEGGLVLEGAVLDLRRIKAGEMLAANGLLVGVASVRKGLSAVAALARPRWRSSAFTSFRISEFTSQRPAMQSLKLHTAAVGRAAKGVSDDPVAGPSADEETSAFEALSVAEGLQKARPGGPEDSVPPVNVEVTGIPLDAASVSSKQKVATGAAQQGEQPPTTAPPYFFFNGRWYYALPAPPAGMLHPPHVHPTATFLHEHLSKAGHSFSEAMTKAESVAMKAAAINDKTRFRFILVVATITIGTLVYSAWPTIKTETQESLVAAAGDVLGNKDLQVDASTFAKAVINETLSDPKIHALLVSVATEALQDPKTQDTVRMFSYDLLQWLSKEPWFNKLVVDLVAWTLAQQYVIDATAQLGTASLADPALQDMATKALVDVFWRAFEDKALQDKAQAWTWSVVSQSITPGFFGSGKNKHQKPGAAAGPPPSSPTPATSATPTPSPLPPTTSAETHHAASEPVPGPSFLQGHPPYVSQAHQQQAAPAAQAPVVEKPVSTDGAVQAAPELTAATPAPATTGADLSEAAPFFESAFQAVKEELADSSNSNAAEESAAGSAGAISGDATGNGSSSNRRRRLRSMSDILLRTPVEPTAVVAPATSEGQQPSPPPTPRGPLPVSVASDSGFGGESLTPSDWQTAVDVRGPGIVKGIRDKLKKPGSKSLQQEKAELQPPQQQQEASSPTTPDLAATEASASTSIARNAATNAADHEDNARHAGAVTDEPSSEAALEASLTAVAEAAPVTSPSSESAVTTDTPELLQPAPQPLEAPSAEPPSASESESTATIIPPPIVDLSATLTDAASSALTAANDGSLAEEEPAVSVSLTAPVMVFTASADEEPASRPAALQPSTSGSLQAPKQEEASTASKLSAFLGSLFKPSKINERDSAPASRISLFGSGRQPLSMRGGRDRREAAAEAERKLSSAVDESELPDAAEALPAEEGVAPEPRVVDAPLGLVGEKLVTFVPGVAGEDAKSPITPSPGSEAEEKKKEGIFADV
jgi:hypothetical protein